MLEGVFEIFLTDEFIYYDGPSVNEKIYFNIFSPLYFVGRKYI